MKKSPSAAPSRLFGSPRGRPPARTVASTAASKATGRNRTVKFMVSNMPGIGTITVSSLAAIFGIGGIYLRRRISRNWIDYRSQGPTDLSDKGVIVITGANVGLGYEAAKEFAKRNATVVLACRDPQKAKEAARRIVKSTPCASAERLECKLPPLDLASLDSVNSFSSQLMAKYPRIYALVCNAGVWIPMEEEHKTADGYEAHFGINHLGHFALINRIKDHMAKASKEDDCRIILVSSGLLKNGKIDMDKQDFVYDGRKVLTGAEDSTNDDTTSGTDKPLLPNESKKKKKRKNHETYAPTGYCDSKLMNALTVQHLATKLGETAPHVTTYACSPGFCRSQLGRYINVPLYKKLLVGPLMLMIQRTSRQGAQNLVHATLENRTNLESGAIYRDGEVAKDETSFIDSLDEELQKKLWELSEKLTAKK